MLDILHQHFKLAGTVTAGRQSLMAIIGSEWGRGGYRGGGEEGEGKRGGGRDRDREDTNSKTLFYEDCTLGAAKKNLSDNPGGAGSGTLYP